MVKIELNDILQLEFLHDNPDDLKIIKNGNLCCNMIERKHIIIDTSNNNPEEKMKELIFDNINYKDLKIRNSKLDNNITIDDKVNFKDTIILVFDNMQLKSENIKMMKYIFKDKHIKIFIPFIFFAEQLLNNVKPYKIKQIIEHYKEKFVEYCDEIIIDNYFTETNDLLDFYSIEAENIGFYYDDINDKLINYNIFSSTNNLIIKNQVINNENTKKKKQLIYQLNIVYKFLKKFKIGDKRQKIYKNIEMLKTKFELYFIHNNKINENVIITEDIYKLFIDIQTFIMSLKESRDTYYLKEIKSMMLKDIYIDSQFFYITTDEISNCRCIIEQISTINIYGDIPRYIITLRDNKVMLKLFNIFQNLIKVTDTNNEIYKLIDNARKINSQQIINNSKNLLTKIYHGGLYRNNEQIININNIFDKKIDFFKLNLDKNIKDFKYKEAIYIMNEESQLKFIKNKNYMEILNYIKNIYSLNFKLCGNFDIDNYKTIEEITKQNPILLDTIKQFNQIFEELEFLYDTISPKELIKNLKKIDKRNILNKIEDTGKLMSDEEIKELDDAEKIPDIKYFTGTIDSVFNGNYDKFKNVTKKNIPEDKWRGIYCAWFLEIGLNYHFKDDTLKFYKYIFPDLFKKYPINDFVMLFNIDTEYNIRIKNKKFEDEFEDGFEDD